MKNLLRFGYAPLMLFGANGAAIALARAGRSGWIAAPIAAAIAFSFLVERIIPYEQDWNRPRDDAWRDLAHALVNELLDVASVALLPLIASVVTVAEVWPHHWPFVLQVLAAILVFDAGVTLAHGASHRVDALWRLHAVHHSVQRFYGFNGLMKHPLHQTFELAVGVAPLVAIGLPADIATALAACVVVQLLLQHSNADYRVGPLRYVLALNEGHRFHHLKWPGIGDVNFGLFTSIWDHLLGTFSFDPARRFTSDDFGIAKWPTYPVGYLAQLAAPFRGEK